jgi:CHAT domain-containing protein/tetratricopeptide (TPR) repeat protein
VGLFATSPVGLALGGSAAAEELKGEPGQATAAATATLTRARERGDPAGEAAARADLGLALVLQGLPGAAQPNLAEAMRTGAPEVALLAALWERLATSLRFNAFADGQGAGGVEILARWDAIADAQAATARLDALAAAAPRSPVLRVRLLTQLITALAPIRNTLELARSVPSPPRGLLDTLLPGLLFLEQEAQIPRGWVAFGRLGAADACRRAGEPARAAEWLGAALEAYGEVDDTAGAGACHLTAADWLAAPFSSPLHWNLAVRGSASEGSDLDWQLEAAEFGEAGMDLDGARAGYARAEDCFTAAGAPRGLAAVELRRGYLAVLAGDHEQAARCAAAARRGYAAAGDVAGAHLAAIHEALARIGAGALAEDRATAAAAGGWGAADGSFSIALGLGLLCGRVGRHWRLRHGDTERALACYRLAASLFESLGARLNLAQSLVDQADALGGVGDSAQAGALYEAAVEVTGVAVEGPPAVALVARRRGLLLSVEVLQGYHGRRDADGMQRAGAQVAARLAPLPATADPPEQAVAALAGWLLGQMPTAIPLARAMELRERGRPDEAKPWFEAALAGAAQADPDMRHLLEASVLASQERFAEAREAYGRHTAARDGARSAVALARQLGPEQEQRARRNALEQDFAFLTRVKAWHEAQAAADACQALAGTEWWNEQERPWGVLSDLGEVREGLGHLEPALRYYEHAMDALDARRGLLASTGLRAALAGAREVQWLSLFGARCALRLAEHDPPRAQEALARAFRAAERGKARALLDLMAASAARVPGRAGEPSQRQRWREMGARVDVAAQLLERRRASGAGPQEVDTLERRLAQDQEVLRTLEAELARSDPGWLGGLRASGEVASLADVVSELPPGAALLQWVFLGRDLLAWAITSDGIVARTHQELDTWALSRAIRELRAACEGRTPGWETGAKAVARTLLGPFEAVLADHERIIVVPYGVGHELPVQVLPWRGTPLAVTHRISVLPSASVLRFTRGGAGRPWRVLAVGNPARMAYRPPGAAQAEPAPPLGGAEAEAMLAAAAFAGGEALCGEAATEEAVRPRLVGFPVLHFATHGRLEQDAPGLSCLLLADGEALSVYELAGLELDVDLAVLSACRTGQGEATRGDDVVGLARGLLGAGCRAAVVSLWPVDDASTALLMSAFYRKLTEGSPPVDALRAAQLHVRALGATQAAAELAELRVTVPPGTRDMLDRLPPAPAAGYDHPYHWAPFTLLGTGITARGDP